MPPSQLDIDRVLRESFVARAEYHATIASTNDRAMRLASEGSVELPLLVVAAEQTAGRGRGGHQWWTGRGSLAMSLLLGPEQLTAARDGRVALVALAAAVAIVDTVAPRMPAQAVGIRWPNDVTADETKLAGVLVEVLPDGRHVVGIGVNTNNSLEEAPPELRSTATTMLQLTGRTHDQTELLICLLREFQGALEQLAGGPEQIGMRADVLCVQHHQMLQLQWGKRLIRGRCAGIAPDGALLLETPQGRKSFCSGALLP